MTVSRCAPATTPRTRARSCTSNARRRRSGVWPGIVVLTFATALSRSWRIAMASSRLPTSQRNRCVGGKSATISRSSTGSINRVAKSVSMTRRRRCVCSSAAPESPDILSAAPRICDLIESCTSRARSAPKMLPSAPAAPPRRTSFMDATTPRLGSDSSTNVASWRSARRSSSG